MNVCKQQVELFFKKSLIKTFWLAYVCKMQGLLQINYLLPF
jgi:hypothetical protein